MISAVNNVSFGDSAQDLINSPGQFTTMASVPEMKPDSFEMENGKKKSHKGLKALLGVVVVALAAFIALGVAVKKGNLKSIEVPTEGAMAKAKAKIQNFGVKVGEKAESWYESIAKMFNKGEKAAKSSESK